MTLKIMAETRSLKRRRAVFFCRWSFFIKTTWSIPDRRPIAPSRIDCAQANAGLLFNHDSFTVAKISRLVRQLVTARGERSLRVARQPVWLVNQFIRQPLMMNARGIDRLLDIHVVVDHVRNHIKHGIDDRRTARTADREPERAVFAHHK